MCPMDAWDSYICNTHTYIYIYINDHLHNAAAMLLHREPDNISSDLVQDEWREGRGEGDADTCQQRK